MPLEKPVVTLGGKTWWRVLERYHGMVLQAHVLPSIWLYNPYRVLIEYNHYQLASAASQDAAQADFVILKEVFNREIQPQSVAWKTEAEYAAGLLAHFDKRWTTRLPSSPGAALSTAEGPSAKPPSRPPTPGEELRTISVGAPGIQEEASTAGRSLTDAAVHSSEETRLEGWLAKLPQAHGEAAANAKMDKLPTTGWERRYFILKRGCLFYYETTIKTTVTLDCEFQIVTTPAGHLQTLSAKKFGYCFSIETLAKRVACAVETQSEMTAWIASLQSLRMSDVLSVDSGTVLEKRGWMFLQISPSTEFKYRYCIMNNKSLEVYEAVEKGCIKLVNGEVEKLPSPGSVFKIKYVVKNIPSSVYLKAMDDAVMESWIRAINAELEQTRQSSTLTTLLEGSDVKAIALMNKIRDVLDAEHARLLKLYPNPTLPPRNKKRLNILSFDGGGLRGIMSTILLERIQKVYPDFLDQFDFVAGTSNGSMIAMGLAFGWRPSSCKALLEVTAETVLSKTGFRGGIDCAKFPVDYLKLFCEESWQNRKLRDASKFLLVPTFLLDNKQMDKTQGPRRWQNTLSHNLDDEHGGELASDVVLRSSAAPTYFPSHQGYVDGGMFAHDPSSLALVLAMSRLGKSPADITIMSLGTGLVSHQIEGTNHDWGMVQWVPYLSSLLWDGMVQKSETICSELLGPRYHRVNPVLERDVPLDDHAQIPILTQIGRDHDLSPTLAWIRTHLYEGAPPPPASPSTPPPLLSSSSLTSSGTLPAPSFLGGGSSAAASSSAAGSSGTDPPTTLSVAAAVSTAASKSAP